MVRPSQFLKEYRPVSVQTEAGYKAVEVNRYVSGSPWKKQWPKKAIWDLFSFVTKRDRYKGGKNCDGWHEQYQGYFIAENLYPQKWIDISWETLALCFYGKGTPETFVKALKVIAYYLKHADLKLSSLGWSKVMSLQEYAYWYLGLDCNGFAGSYYAKYLPHVGIDGNDHINYLKDKGTLAKRETIDDIKSGDLLVREGSSGGGKRHVALVESVAKTSATKGLAGIAQSSSSRGGLNGETFSLVQLSGKEKDSHGALGWHLLGYFKFHYILGPS